MSTSRAHLEEPIAPSTRHGETELLARRREEEKVALIRAHLVPVWGFLRRLGLSPEDAEDAAQEVFLTVIKKLDAIFDGHEKRFLFGVAVRVASHRRRALKSHGSRLVELEVESVESGAIPSDELMERKQALVLLDRALASLDEELRAVFILYELEEMTMQEIANVTETPLGTVSTRLRRAREQFQKATRRLQARQT